jgi:hypothetical protein
METCKIGNGTCTQDEQVEVPGVAWEYEQEVKSRPLMDWMSIHCRCGAHAFCKYHFHLQILQIINYIMSMNLTLFANSIGLLNTQFSCWHEQITSTNQNEDAFRQLQNVRHNVDLKQSQNTKHY